MSVKTSSNGGLSDKGEDNSQEEGGEQAESERVLTTDEVFHILQNERRRRILAYLREHDQGDGVDMREIVEWVAAQEHDTTVSALRSKERQRVYIALYQSHLPKLDDYGLVTYNQRRGWVTLTDAAESVFPYLGADRDGSDDASDGSTPAYDMMALGGGVLLLAGAWFDVSLFASVQDIVIGALILALFAAVTAKSFAVKQARNFAESNGE